MIPMPFIDFAIVACRAVPHQWIPLWFVWVYDPLTRGCFPWD